MPNSRGNSKPGRDIVVIGASAGGLEVVMRIVERLPKSLPAAIFVVSHTGPDAPGALPQILGRRSDLPAQHAGDGERIEHGRIYCAPPDHHLLIEAGYIRVFRGPKENGFRPAIDPLFRSAAAAYATRVVGVVLSGALDDGVHGLMRIKHRGGIAVVQNPEEAVVDALPLNAIKYVEVDHIAGAEEIANLLDRLARQPAPEEFSPMHDKEAIEADVADGVHHILGAGKPQHVPSAFTCPDCGGALWETEDGKLSRFRCHVGHAYTADSLMTQKDAALENVLWSALRALEESAAFRHRMAKRAREGRISSIAEKFEQRANEDQSRAAVLREFLLTKVENHAQSLKGSPKRRKSSTVRRDGRKRSSERSS